MNHIETYLEDIRALSSQIDAASLSGIFSALAKAREEGGRIFVCGNGGSAALATHFACDLGKNTAGVDKPRFQILSLNDNMSCITAYANDCGYDTVFAEQMKNFRPGNRDILFAISASGNSPNIVRVCEYARSMGCQIIGLAGFTGGKLKEYSDFCFHVPSMEYEKVEDLHMVATHIIVSYFKYCSEDSVQ